MFTPYPTEFPQEALIMALDLTRGKVAGTPEAVHACWNVAGYALARTIGSGPAITGATGDSDVEVIEQALLQGPASQVTQGLFPWGLVVTIMLKLLARYAA
jgi:hypothetical protein